MNSVNINTKNDPGFSRLTVTSSGELMKNLEAASVVDATHRIDVAQDSDGNPVIFSIGNDGEFYVIFRHTSSHTGWNKTDLSAMIGSELKATAFGIYQNAQNQQNAQNKIMLAVAVCANGGTDDCTIYMSPYLANSPAGWDEKTVAWKKRPFAQGKIGVSGFQVGADHTGSKNPLAIAAVTRNGQGEHWQVNSDHSNDAWSMTEFLLPENAQEILDMAIGEIEGQQGAYALYKTATGKSLEFTTLPFKAPHTTKTQRLNYTFDLPGDINSIEALPTNTDSYDLYGAGDGVHRWHGTSRVSQPIAADVSAVSELIVRQDTARISIWMVQGDEKLQYVHGARDGEAGWSAPLILGTEVTQIAALRNGKLQTNEVFMVKGNKSMSYFFQDPLTTRWQETPIPLPDLKKNLKPFDTYTTRVILTDDRGTPVILKPVRIRASEWAYVSINGVSHALAGRSAPPIEVTTNEMGALTIVNRVRGLSTPVFEFTADWFSDAVEVDPSSKARGLLSKIKNGDDLKNAKLQNGEPLLKKGFKGDELNDVAKVVSKLSDTVQSLSESSKSHPAAVASRAAGLPKSEIWGMSFGNGKMAFHEGDHALSRIAPMMLMETAMGAPAVPMTTVPVPGIEDGIRAIECVAGDLLEAIEHEFVKVEHFLVHAAEDGLHFIIKFGEKVFHFVATSVAIVLRAVDWVLKNTLGITLEDIVSWLGFVFNWEDILKLKKVFCKMAELAEIKAKQEIGQLEGKVHEGADQLQQLLDEWTKGKGGEARAGFKQNVIDTAKPKDGQNPQVSEHHSSPAFSWILDHTLGYLEVIKLAPEGLESYAEKIGAKLEKAGVTEVKDLEDAVGRMYKEVIQNIGTSPIEKTIDHLVEIIGSTIITSGERALITQLDIIEIAIEAFWLIIDTEIQVPVISNLYEEVGDGSKLTLLDLCCLIAAVPAEIGSKLAGVPMLSDDDLEHIGNANSLDDLLKPRLAEEDALSSQASAPVPDLLMMEPSKLPHRDWTLGVAGASEGTMEEGSRLKGKPQWEDTLVVILEFSTAGLNTITGICNVRAAVDPLGLDSVGSKIALCLSTGAGIVKFGFTLFYFTIFVGRKYGLMTAVSAVMVGIDVVLAGIVVALAGILVILLLLASSLGPGLEKVLKPLGVVAKTLWALCMIIYSVYSVISSGITGVSRLVNKKKLYGEGHEDLFSEDVLIQVLGMSSSICSGITTFMLCFESLGVLTLTSIETGSLVIPGLGEVAAAGAEEAKDGLIEVSLAIVGLCSIVPPVASLGRGFMMADEVRNGYRVDVFDIHGSPGSS